MLPTGNGGSAPVYGHALSHVTYERYRPEHTLLYQLIEKHFPALVEQLDAQGRSLPTHVHREFEAYLKCGRLEHGFLRLRCATCRLERLVAISWTQRLKRVFNIDRGLRSLQRIGNGFSAGPLDNLVAGNVAHTRSGMSGYELHEHRRTSFSGQ